MPKISIKDIIIFLKAQLSSLSGGIVDYITMVFFTEVFHIHYTISIAIGGIVGAIVNFIINKNWTFKSARHNYQSTTFKQFMKFILVVINSILLKASGTYFITNYTGLDYKISRIIIDLIVSLAFNFTLQKNWVFKKSKENL